MTSYRQPLWWLLFGVGLLVAIAGWMWIMVRLVRNESEAADARVRQAEEKLLTAEAEELSSALLRFPLPDESSIPDLATSGACSGWWKPLEIRDLPPNEDGREAIRGWRERLRCKQASAADLKQALAEGELRWGWIEGGRDLAAGLLPSLYRNGDRSPELIELLDERVWNYTAPPINPAFRLTLIRTLLALKPSEELKRLLEIETIRAAEGRTEDLGQNYEMIALKRDGAEVMTFWSRTQLLQFLETPDDYRLFQSPPDDRASVRVSELRQWPYLSARSAIASSAAEAGGRSLVWIGGASGLALVALALTAILVGRHQLRTARMRTDLAASVAHELRTPLAGQRLLLETLMERKDQSEEARAEYIAMAFRENKRLGRLAEEFLTFSRLERGVLQLEVEPVDLSEVVEGAVESLREKWEDPECELRVGTVEDLPRVSGDHQALITILRNLLENAWKYSSSPRRIEVRAQEAGDEIEITVADNGIGLSSAEQQRIFKQFYRVDRRLARSEDGLGLGLSIVKRLLESMQGSIDVSSDGNNGSEFTIRIPKAT